MNFFFQGENIVHIPARIGYFGNETERTWNKLNDNSQQTTPISRVTSIACLIFSFQDVAAIWSYKFNQSAAVKLDS